MTTPNLVAKPAPGAIERDWTNETLVLDVANAMGENFHFEINADSKVIGSAVGNTGWGGKFQMDMILPIL